MTSNWDIFVSYASPNKQTADAFVQQLEARGTTCWIAPRNIDPGGDYGEEIVLGIQNSLMFVVVFSAQADGSKHVLREVDRAIGFDKVIVPIKIDSAVPTGGMDYRLCTVQWVEAGESPIPKEVVQDTLTVLDAARKRESPGPSSDSPEYIILKTCSRCGVQYAEHNPSGCSFHPQPPENIGTSGEDHDYADIWQFPCCGQKYVGTFREDGGGILDQRPPKSPGCVNGRHTPTAILPVPGKLLPNARLAAKILNDDAVTQKIDSQFDSFLREHESWRKRESSPSDVMWEYRDLQDLVVRTENRVKKLQKDTDTWFRSQHLEDGRLELLCLKCAHRELMQPEKEDECPSACPQCGYDGEESELA